MGVDVQCLILLIVVAILFITEIIPIAVTAMLGAIMCGVLGFIPTSAVFSGLSNSTVVLFAGMFVVGAALFYTGLAQKIGEAVVKISGTNENSLMLGIMLVAAALSSVLSNTGTAACLMPVVLGICSAANIPASRQLMPLAFSAGLGGIITKVGTPPNIIAAGILANAGYKTFGFFEFAYIGIPLTVAGILYMIFIGKHFLPKIDLDETQVIEQEIEASVNVPKSKQIISCGLTQFMSNTAAAALLCPIGIAIAQRINASPQAVLMAIAVAASCAFSTPVGTPPNTLVMTPGGYKFKDYMKAGIGLVVVCFIVSILVIPQVWPFFPGK